MDRCSNTPRSTQARPPLLLMEPDHATRQLYARELARYWDVLQAQNVDEAQQHFTSQTPVAVVLEPWQAGGAGMAAAWAFLQQGAALLVGADARTEGAAPTRRIPFVVCSVLDERATAYAMGAALYLLKPFSPQQLVIELQRLLDATAAPLNKEQIG
jgi:DNA-binding response OmpR family regulator